MPHNLNDRSYKKKSRQSILTTEEVFKGIAKMLKEEERENG